MQNSIILGVDIGGSHITSALVDIETRSILKNSLRRQRVDSAGSPEAILDSWAEVLKESLLLYPNSKVVSIAMPGPFDYVNGISFISGLSKYEKLYNLNIRELLMQRLHPLAECILFINDATCFLQGEVFSGTARDYRNVLGFTLGTGFGSAIVENGQIKDADYWNYPFKGSICENYISSRWLVNRYFELSGRKVENVKEIIEDAYHSEARQMVFNEFSDNLFAFLIEILKERKMSAIVFGGNISNANDLFLPKLKSNFAQSGFDVELLISELGESAALIGAASFAESDGKIPYRVV